MKAEEQSTPRSPLHSSPATHDFLASDFRSCCSASINSMPFRTSCQRAFTLLDLIVTLAIIALLALTLAPALAKSGGKAARVNCFNNKRHIQAACAMYSAEWNDWLVPNAPVGFNAGWCYG